MFMVVSSMLIVAVVTLVIAVEIGDTAEE